jgi:pimeloyl-[acyl-carrier protein] methyl ester esterase
VHGSKPSLVFFSGWAYPPEVVEPFLAGLRGTFDLRLAAAESFLEGALPTPPDAARAFLEELPLPDGRTFLAGWSLGGMLAMEMAAAAGPRISGLVLAGTTPRFCAGADFLAGAQEKQLRSMMLGLKRDPRKVLERFDLDCAHPHAPLTGRGACPATGQPVSAATEASPSRGSVEALLGGLRYLQARDLRPVLPRLRLPCSILHGRQDRIVSWRAGEWLHQNLPGSRLRILDGVGHDLPLRCPESILRALHDIDGEAP